MKKDVNSLIKKKFNDYKFKRNCQKIISLLSCIVFFWTIYLLMIPAITQNTVTTSTLKLRDGYEYAWKNDSQYITSYDLKLHFVDTNGNYIKGQDIELQLGMDGYPDSMYGLGVVPTNGQDLIDVNKLNKYTLVTGEKYEFDHAELSLNNGNSWIPLNSTNGNHQHIWCQYSSSQNVPDDILSYGWRGRYWDTTTNKDVDYIINENVEYKLVYKLIRQGQNASIASLGADSGIKFNIYNYSGDNSSTGENNINNNGVYNFFTFRGLKKGVVGSINATIDADGFTTNRTKVLPTLDSTNNPVFDCQNYSGCTNFSLGYLFGTNKNPLNETPKGVSGYSAKNTLLQKDMTTGYYYYDSSLNAVDYDTENNLFMLRNYQERSYYITTYPDEANRYEFLPFNYWTPDYQLQTNTSTNRNYNYEEAFNDVETIENVEYVDHWYGMTMEFNFYMPKDGIIDGSAMVFEFSGDDDVWVFIDDVLVLDLGGTHGAVDGTINFKTGEVKSYMNWNGTNNSDNANTTSIYKAYMEAGASNTTSWNSNNTTYENYTKHTLKFFYLERGGAVANCKIKFNIPVIPSGSLSVQKKYEGINNYPNDEYEFTLYDVTANSPVVNATYTIDEAEYQTDENGNFKLKNTEVAVFKLINEHSYYVEETNPNIHSVSSGCTLDGVDCDLSNKTGYFTINPEATYQAIFTNKVKTYNLKVSKVVAYTNNIGDEEFEFKVTLKDSTGLPVNIMNATNFEYTFDQLNGTITFNLKAGEDLTITEIPINTIVTLKETKHNGYQTIIKSGDITLANGDIYEFCMDTNKNITVYNNPGVKLPDTGGPGIFKYLIIGIGLILIPIVYGYCYFLKTKGSDE